jgi:Cdc6-like AAA superfamily ATPase
MTDSHPWASSQIVTQNRRLRLSVLRVANDSGNSARRRLDRLDRAAHLAKEQCRRVLGINIVAVALSTSPSST